MPDQGVEVVKWHLPGHLQLISTQRAPSGQRIFWETPLIWVKEGGDRHPAWELTERLMTAPASKQEYLAWNLRRIPLPTWDAVDQEILTRLSKKYRTSKPLIKSIYISVVTNSIACQTGGDPPIQGHGLFRLMSRANHSCVPNAEMVSGDVASGGNAFQALEDIETATPISYNYLWANALTLDFRIRNMLLVDRYGFVCECERCKAECPNELKAVDKLAFFQHLIKDQQTRIKGSF